MSPRSITRSPLHDPVVGWLTLLAVALLGLVTGLHVAEAGPFAAQPKPQCTVTFAHQEVKTQRHAAQTHPTAPNTTDPYASQV